MNRLMKRDFVIDVMIIHVDVTKKQNEFSRREKSSRAAGKTIEEYLGGMPPAEGAAGL